MGIEERRERERQARKTAVLQATRELVLERGFKGATTKRIAERCELSEATLFFYFQNKEEIYLSLLFEGIDFASRAIDRIVAMEAPAQDKLEAVWAFFSEVRAEHPEYFFVFSYLAHPRATSEVTETVRDEIARRSGDNFRRLADVLSVAVGVDNARLVGDLLWSAFAGLMVLRDTRTNLGAPSHPSETELAAAFRLLLSGIAPQRADGEKA